MDERRRLFDGRRRARRRRHTAALTEATRHAYASLVAWVRASATPHFLRIWNYFDAINAGDGDEERYRHFCSGRAAAG